MQEAQETNKPLALIVEDHDDSAVIAAAAVNLAGYNAEVVNSGDKALAWLDENLPELVILDLHLPRVSGTEVLRRIRADARMTAVRVIVVTAHPESLDEEQRADALLCKPVGFGQLRDIAEKMRMSGRPAAG